MWEVGNKIFSKGFEVPIGSGKQNKSMQNQKIKSINQSINQLMDKSIKRAIFKKNLNVK